jgi:ectoine hydroxylase-related dioxygenase (phytanoyl-CoA dioxygenase family)
MDYQSYSGIERTILANESDKNIERLERDGYFIIESVIRHELLCELRSLLDKAWEKQVALYGEDLLKKIGDWGQIRGLVLESDQFLNLVVHPEIMDIVNRTTGPTSILHLQNGIVSHPNITHNQARFHRDFAKDFIASKILSINALIAIDDFTENNGGTWIVPGSHKVERMPSDSYLQEQSIQVSIPAGGILFFDSLLWHKGGVNHSTSPRRAINQQYTRPFIKQQLDYPRMIQDRIDIETKMAQTLGCWSIPPIGVDQYRVSEPKLRTYRAGQG